MFDLKMVTYEGLYKQAEVESINVPTNDGRRGILPNHMPIILTLCVGVVAVKVADGSVSRYTVGDGVLYFEDNKAILLSDVIEDVASIDVDRARQAAQRARQRLDEAMPASEVRRATVALARAENRLKAAEKR